MSDFYTWATPNGRKIQVWLEELDLLCKLSPMNIRAGEQFEENFFEVGPNNRIPLMTDHDPVKGDQTHF